MTVYVEYVIINNMVINAILLWFTFRTIKHRPVKWRILLSAAIGTAFALVIPLIVIPGVGGAFAMIGIKFFMGAFMVFVACGNMKFVRQVLFFLLFLSYTFAFGGAIYGLAFAFGSAQSSMLFFTQNTSVPIGVFAGGAFAFGFLMSKLIKFLNVRHSINNYLRDVIITYKDNKFKITSYLDTGNRLVDPKSNAPVVIITMSLFLKMFPDISVDRIALNKLAGENIDDGHYINFSTIERQSQMFVFAPSSFEIIDRKTKTAHQNVRLGVSMKGFRDAVKYDALLNANLV